MRTFEGYLKGINLGGWLSQCGKKYNEEHYNTFITKKDIDLIASWGLDHVRLPVDYNVVQNEDGTFIESGFRHIDDCIAWCEANNLKIVLDLHKTCGFVFDNKNYCNFFTERKLQDMFIALWMEFTRRYGANEHIAFELLNEVTDAAMAEPWNKISAETIAAIRTLAPKKKIIIGGIYNSSIYGLTLLTQPADENIVFTFHCYSPMIFTHQAAGWIEQMPKSYSMTYPLPASTVRTESFNVFGADYDGEFGSLGDDMMSAEYFRRLFSTAVSVAEKYNVPLYCGEYGVIDSADLDSTLAWYKDIHTALSELNLARAAWSYKQMDFGISDERNKNILNQLISNL